MPGPRPRQPRRRLCRAGGESSRRVCELIRFTVAAMHRLGMPFFIDRLPPCDCVGGLRRAQLRPDQVLVDLGKFGARRSRYPQER